MLMESAELQRRLKMENLLRKSQQKSATKENWVKIRSLFDNYQRAETKRSTTIIINCMKFERARRRNILQKYFANWAIFQYQKQIEDQEEQIITGKYLQGRSNKRLVKQAFEAWKKYLLFLKGR